MDEDIRVQMAFDDMDSDDTLTRVAAMETLGQFKYRPAVPKIIEALRHPDASVRQKAVDSLVTMGGIAILPALFNLLRDDNLPDREAVIRLGEETVDRFAHEVHDGVAAKLAAAVMQVTIIERYLERDPSRIPGELAQLKQLTSAASQEVRSIITNLRAISPGGDRSLNTFRSAILWDVKR
jgi:signal transduction histidine kinase